MLTKRKKIKTSGLLLIAPVFFMFMPSYALAQVPKHLSFMANTLYNDLEETLENVPADTEHGKILQNSKKILKKSYIDKFSAESFSSPPVDIKEELEKALDIYKLTPEEMAPFLAQDFYMYKVERVKDIYNKRDKRQSNEDKFYDIAENVVKALGARWNGMESSHTIDVEDDSRVVLDWDQPRHDFKMLVEKDGKDGQEGFSTLLRADVDAEYDPETGKSDFSLQPAEDAIQPLNEEEMEARNNVMEASIWGEWLSTRGDTWVFSSVDEKAHGTARAEKDKKKENSLTSLSAKKARLNEIKNQKLYIWKNAKTGETINQKKFKKVKDENFEFQGQDYTPEIKEEIKKLEGEIGTLGEENKEIPLDQHDPIEFGNMLGQGPLTITVTDKDGYSFTYDEVYHDKGTIRARRTLRDVRDITNLPKTIVKQLVASWSPPEWIEIQVAYDYVANRMVMNVDRFRLHVTYDGWSMTVSRIHTPYKYVWDLKRAEEFDPTELRFLDANGTEITEELPYDEPVQVEAVFDKPQNTDKRMVRLSWSGDNVGLSWIEVQSTGDRKTFRSEPFFFIPPDTESELGDERLKL